MITTSDGVNLYSQQEYDEISTQQYQVGIDYATNATSNRLRTRALDWFKSEVRGGAMAQEDALGIFNGLADALGWETVDRLTSLYTVVVNYNGTTIAEFGGVEADDEDSAVEEVRDNMEVEDVEINFTLSYNGDTCRESANTTWDFDTDDLELEAEEQ